MAPQPQTETLATVSLVLGCVGLLLACCYLGGALGVGGVITGVLARKKIAESGGLLTGDGLALGGIVVSGIAIALTVLLVLLGILGQTSYWL